MPLGAWILAMISPMIGRILTTIGFQVVSIVGMVAIMDGLKGLVMTHLGAVPAAGLQLALLAGVGEGLGIIFGAITTRILLWQASNATRILGVSS